MTRLEIFNSFYADPMLSRDLRRLLTCEINECINFIAEHNHLDKNAFAEKANRWMLDQPRPKNYSLMWALVSQANGPAFKESN